MNRKEVNRILKGLNLTSKDAVTDYILSNGLPYARWSRLVGEIGNERHGMGYHWSPRGTFTTDYREALAKLLIERREGEIR